MNILRSLILGFLFISPGFKPVTLTVLYDNASAGNPIIADQGFSCLIESRSRTALFDTGRNPATLMSNAKKMSADLSRIDLVVVSHIHDDHMGALMDVLAFGGKPALCLPFSYPQTAAEPHTERSDRDYQTLLDQLRARASSLIQKKDGGPIEEGLWTTGMLEDQSYEQAVIVPTAKGLVVITGCAHPGIVKIVKRAKELLKRDVDLVLGGFHLTQTDPARVKEIAGELRALTKRVGPCHCTGERARAIFKEIFKDDYVDIRAGVRITL